MANFKSLTIWTIVLSFFMIVEVYGYGIGCIGIFEIGLIIEGLSGHVYSFSLSIRTLYNDSFMATALFSLVGQVLLILSIIVKGQKVLWSKIFGVLFLWAGFYYLTHNFFDDQKARISFFFGIPFLICSALLTYRIIKENL